MIACVETKDGYRIGQPATQLGDATDVLNLATGFLNNASKAGSAANTSFFNFATGSSAFDAQTTQKGFVTAGLVVGGLVLGGVLLYLVTR